jgi:hypothetical protein
MSANPEPSAAHINCQNSFVLQDAYSRDRVLQNELQELEDARLSYQRYTDLIAWWDHTLKMRKLRMCVAFVFKPRTLPILTMCVCVHRPPAPPPPPPPLPPPPASPGCSVSVAPPFPPRLVTPEQQTAQLEAERDKIARRIDELVSIVSNCQTSRTTICGLPKNEVSTLRLHTSCT